MIESIPQLKWFFSIQGGYKVINTYLGSTGTDYMGGFINSKTYNYKISVNFNENDEPYLTVESFVLNPWREQPLKTELPSKDFEFTDEGLQAILAHLNEQATESIGEQDER